MPQQVWVWCYTKANNYNIIITIEYVGNQSNSDN